MRFFDMLRNERGEVGPKKDEEENEPNPALDEEHNIEEEEEKDEEGSLEIDLDENDEPAPKEDKKWAEMRIENKELKETLAKQQEQINSLSENQYQAPVQQTQQRPAGDPNDPMNWSEEQWDELAKTDWKKAVDLRAEIKARQQYQTASSNIEHNRVLEDSKVKVLQRHPELSDPNSEKSKIFRNVVTANPEYASDKKGPLHAMYEMEDFMVQNMGYKREDVVKAEKRAREEESQRHNTVALTSTTGRHTSASNTVTLTKDEQDFCQLQGLDPKTYAANKKKLASAGGRGGIQL